MEHLTVLELRTLKKSGVLVVIVFELWPFTLRSIRGEAHRATHRKLFSSDTHRVQLLTSAELAHQFKELSMLPSIFLQDDDVAGAITILGHHSV